jgi:hypothetical protein
LLLGQLLPLLLLLERLPLLGELLRLLWLPLLWLLLRLLWLPLLLRLLRLPLLLGLLCLPLLLWLAGLQLLLLHVPELAESDVVLVRLLEVWWDCGCCRAKPGRLRALGGLVVSHALVVAPCLAS